MDKKEQQIAVDEFRATRDQLVQLSSQRMFEFESKNTRLQERKHSFIITLSSLALALVGVVFPIYLSTETSESGMSLTVGVALLVLSAIFGIVVTIYLNFKDDEYNKLQNSAEMPFLRKQLTGITNLLSAAYDGDLEDEEVESHFTDKEKARQLYSKTIAPVTRYYSTSNTLYYLFLLIFSAGFAFFLVGILPM